MEYANIVELNVYKIAKEIGLKFRCVEFKVAKEILNKMKELEQGSDNND